jgi:hypothetical protein
MGACGSVADAALAPEDLDRYRTSLKQQQQSHKEQNDVSLYGKGGNRDLTNNVSPLETPEVSGKYRAPATSAAIALDRFKDNDANTPIKAEPAASDDKLPKSAFKDALKNSGLIRQATMTFEEKHKPEVHDKPVSSGHPYLGPIRLIHLQDFTDYGEIPRYPDCSRPGGKMDGIRGKGGTPKIVFDIHQEDEAVNFDRENAFIVFVSHCWLAGWDGCENGAGLGEDWEEANKKRGGVQTRKKIISQEHAHNWRGFPHPDNIRNEKFRLITEGVQFIWESMAKGMKDCYIWMDYCCINQDGDPAGELLYLDQIVSNADCLFTPIVDPDWRSWQPSVNKMRAGHHEDDHTTDIGMNLRSIDSDSKYVQDWFQSYKANAFQGNPYAYIERAWCRVEMLFASNLPISAVSPINHTAVHEEYKKEHNDHKAIVKKTGNKLILAVNKEIEKIRSKMKEDNLQAALNCSAALRDAAKRMIDLETRRRENFTAGLKRITNSGWRPHFLYGTYEQDNNLPVKVMPPLSYSFIDSYNPLGAGLSVETDRKKIKHFLEDLQPFIAKAKNTYTGAIGKDQKKSGKGKFTYADGSIFDGVFENDMREGHGTFTWVNGAQYVGNYHLDKRDGYGEYEAAHGSIYKGSWRNNNRHGHGTFITMNETLEGEFRDGFILKGRQTFKSGDEYDGTYAGIYLSCFLID